MRRAIERVYEVFGLFQEGAMGETTEVSMIIGEFLEEMSATGRRPSSVASYARELETLRQCLHDPPLATISAADVGRFLSSAAVRTKRDGGEKAPTTLNRTRAVIRAFFSWCERTDRIHRSPAFFVRQQHACAPMVRYMSRRELDTFLSRIYRSKHRLARRDHALFATIALTGARLSEASKIVWGDLDLRHHRLALRSVKGGGADSRLVPSRLRRVLLGYRRDTAAPREGPRPIFCSTRGRALAPRSIQYRFAFWLSRAGIRRKMSVHSLRHTFATLLYRATRDLLLVSRALGHRDIRTTCRYAHTDDRWLVRALNRL
jgi:integrase/recombinase XerC